MLDALPFPDDFVLAQKCLDADPMAVRRLQETYRTPLLNYLVHAGALIEEARELVEELWADCLAERPERRPRLATYAGTSPLQGWLKAVALNSLLQAKRSEKRVRKVILDGPPPEVGDDSETSEAEAAADRHDSTEPPLLEIMRDSVQAAFRECDPEEFVLVQLAHTNGLRGRELARLFSCSDSKVRRSLETAREKIAAATLRHVRARDPWLELKWDDFVELCRVVSPASFGVE